MHDIGDCMGRMMPVSKKRVVYYWNKNGVGQELGFTPWRHTFYGAGECIDCGITQKQLNTWQKANPGLFREEAINNANKQEARD